MSKGNNERRHHPFLWNNNHRRITGCIPWSAMNTDGDVFMPGAFKDDAIMAMADQVLDAVGKFRCQACGGSFDKTEASVVAQKLWVMSITVCDKCCVLIKESFKPSQLPSYPPGIMHPPFFGKGYHYAPGGHYEDGKFIIDEISIVPNKTHIICDDLNLNIKVSKKQRKWWKR